MTPIVTTVFTFTVLAFFWLCVAMLVAYHRRVVREDLQYVRICPGDSRPGVGRFEQVDTAPSPSLPDERAPLVMSIYDPISLFELECVCAFEGGYAAEDHWNALDYCVRVLRFGVARRIESEMTTPFNTAEIDWLLGLLNVATQAGKILSRIRDRGCFPGMCAATADELAVLKKLVTTSADFWPKQFRETYRSARLRADRDTYRMVPLNNDGRVSV